MKRSFAPLGQLRPQMSVEGARSRSITPRIYVEKMLICEHWSKTLLRLELNRISDGWKILLSSVSSLEQSAEKIPATGLKDKIYV